MKRLLAALALVLTAFSASVAEDVPTNLRNVRAVARHAGLPDDFQIRAEAGDFNAYFTTGGMVCMWVVFCMEIEPHIGISAPPEWPEEYVVAALLHEVGHYNQRKEGVPTYEWDADLRSARAMCALGMNGPENMAGMLTAITPWVVIDAPVHGNHYQRIEHVRRQRCVGEPHGQQA